MLNIAKYLFYNKQMECYNIIYYKKSYGNHSRNIFQEIKHYINQKYFVHLQEIRKNGQLTHFLSFIVFLLNSKFY